jgi:[NiFe] hydrogenase diaphorase moiety large subunit
MLMTTLFSHEPPRSQTLNLLWEAQDARGYISDDDITRIAQQLHISEVELDGVASFYHFFHRQPAGKFRIYLNNSILSEIKGHRHILSAFEEATGATLGHTDPTQTFGLYHTPCIGLCDYEPSALINLFPFTNLTPEKIHHIITQLKAGQSPEQLADQISDQIRYTPVPEKTFLLREHSPGKALLPLQTLSPDDVINTIKSSGLSGRGGAFFPTAVKWELARNNPGTHHYIICNADEGEPGTFKDRILLNQYPGLLLEGMIMAGYATNAQHGIIYLRAEYRWLLPKLQQTIEAYRQRGLIGAALPFAAPFQFDIRIQLGAGAYVCGEETALLESMEGKRGEPRTKTFFPVQHGYLNQPTVVNNVETLCAAARVIELGSNAFASAGTPLTRGTKLISVAGDCSLPGIYEIEWGMPIAGLLQLAGADNAHYLQVSGPSGQALNANTASHQHIAGEDIPCGGAFMIFNQSRDILQILRNFTEFFKHESCGMCTPCRAGNFIFSRKLEKLSRGLGSLQDLTEMRQWAQIMKLSTRCGLGSSAPNPLLYAIERFPDYFEQTLQANNTGMNRSFDLESALQPYRNAIQNHQP